MHKPDAPSSSVDQKSRYAIEFSELDLSTNSRMLYDEDNRLKDFDPGLKYYHFSSFGELKKFQSDLLQKIEDFNSRHSLVNKELVGYSKDGKWRVRLIENEKMVIKEIRYRFALHSDGKVSIIIYNDEKDE